MFKIKFIYIISGVIWKCHGMSSTVREQLSGIGILFDMGVLVVELWS